MSRSGSSSKVSKARQVNAQAVAAGFRKEVRSHLQELGVEARLVGLLSGGKGPSRVYARVTEKSCRADGIRFDRREVGRYQLEDAIQEANDDPTVHGIIVYYPVFGGEQDGYLREIVRPEKDVEGLGARYRYNLYHDIRYVDEEQRRKSILPCTPLAVLKVLEHYGVHRPEAGPGRQLAGHTATIVNRSEVVGRPLAAMLAHDGARVYSADINGVLCYQQDAIEDPEISAEQAIKQADILVTAVPHADYGPVGAAEVKPGVVALDLSGLNNLAPDITKVASLYGPNIGPVTVAMVERNLVRLIRNFHI